MQNKEISHLSSLYGGYWSHNVLDFCYMTNRYFPPRRMIEDLQSRLPELIGSYPSTNWHLSSLLGKQVGLSHNELVVGNGASELINAIVSRFVHRLAVPVPTFEEFVNRAKILGREVRPFKPNKVTAGPVGGLTRRRHPAHAFRLTYQCHTNRSAHQAANSGTTAMTQRRICY